MTKTRLTFASLLIALGVLACAAIPALALEVHVYHSSFASQGSGAGQLDDPQGVAVNDSTESLTEPAAGDVYVVDEGNNRVERFSSSGVYLGQFNGSGAYEVEGQRETGAAAPTGAFSGPVWVAVDNCTNKLGERCSVAEDPSVGDVYITDNGHEAIDKFSATGEYLGQITQAVCAPPNPENFRKEEEEIKAQEEACPPGVTEPFDGLGGVAVDPAGELWVYQPDGQIDNYSNALANAFLASRQQEGNIFFYLSAPGFAIGPEDDPYTNVHQKYEFPGKEFEFVRLNSAGGIEASLPIDPLLEEISGRPEYATIPASAAAVDLSSGEVYIDSASAVHAFDPVSDKEFEAFGSGRLSGGAGVAVNSSEGLSAGNALSDSVYVADASAGAVTVFYDVVIPEVVSVPAVSVVKREAGHASVGATLSGTVNPAGLPVSSCEFEYGTSTAYGQSVSCEQGLGEGPGEVGKGTSPVAVSAGVTGLLPGTTYHFRLRAANANDAGLPETQLEHVGGDESFVTPGPRLESASVSEVASTAATFHASIDPDSDSTSYYFQYGESRAYEHEVPAAPGASIGSGNGAVEVEREVQEGLLPASTYHYRVVAVSEVAVEVSPGNFETSAEVFLGPDQTFITQRAGTGFVLPDGRQYELVSPSLKQGALFKGIFGTEAAGIGDASAFLYVEERASAAGDAFVDEATAPSEREAQGDANGAMVAMARGPGGWSARQLSPPHRESTGVVLSVLGGEYRVFSEDLSRAVVDQYGGFTPLSPQASESTPYLRTNYYNGDVGERCEGADLSSGTCFTPLVTRADDTTSPFVPFGDAFDGECPFVDCGPQFLMGTPDLSHVLIGSREPLTDTPVKVTLNPQNSTELDEPAEYEFYEGRLRLVNVLPEKTEGGGVSVVNPVFGDPRQRISGDGSRVLLESVANGGERTGDLYLRDVAKEETVQLNLAEPGCPESQCTSGNGDKSDGGYETANSEDTKIFFLDKNKLTRHSSAGSGVPGDNQGFTGDLYECEMVEENGKDKCDLRDLTPETGGEPAEVQSVLGASEDGSYIYFAAGGRLAAGATPHDSCLRNNGYNPCNLYVYHDGVTSFIAELSGVDSAAYGSAGPYGVHELHARVSPDGRYLAFMSQRPLTGYDSEDVTGRGRLDEEVYEYHAPKDLASEQGTLACASCDPSGARPVGVQSRSSWIAGVVPGWSQNGLAPTTAALYQPRYLSNEGRLFFDSKDALVPLDVNGVVDVYEYEPEGITSPEGKVECSESTSSGSEVFKPERELVVEGQPVREGPGCVALISSGSSSEESTFLEASESGGDVFFLTSAKLTAQDVEGGYSIFDAQQCTVAAPCPPAAAEPSRQCETEASCKAPPTPQPEVYGAPASATFSGPGNVSPPPPPATVPKTVAKKTVKCKRNFVKKKIKKQEVCVKKKSRKQSKKAKKSAHTDRRARS